MGQELFAIIDGATNLLSAAVRMGAPLLLASAGLVFTARAGMSNLGTEGVMLMGAFSGVVGAYLTGSPWLGALLAICIGVIFELIVAFLVVTARANQVIVAMATNLLALGLTSSYGRVIFGVSTRPPRVPPYPLFKIPFLADIPVLGPVLFSHNALVYLAFFLVPVTHFILYRTSLGLKVRVVGEHPRAADSVGVNVYLVKYLCCLTRGAMAALAGSYLSLGALNMFTENMVAGRGYMAVSAVIFGKWTPVGSALGALLFGAGDALQMRLQAMGWGLPYQFVQALPYVITLVILTGLVGKAVQPAATGEAYSKE
ncbi:MAG TPA: ABC transporter permease [Clostridia bacterium]|nr:ABC transporter permease [Clostridia bacterium]